MKKIDIVIVNWNSGELLKKCVDSIRNSSFKNYNIFIVDNNSTDNSIKFDYYSSDNIKLFTLDRNIGFAAGCNLGWKSGFSEYVLFLNPDTEILCDTLDKSLNFMDSNSDISVLGCLQSNIHNEVSESCSNFPRLLYFFNGAIGLNKFFPKFFRGPTVLSKFMMNYLKPGYVDEVSGSYYFTRRKVLEQHNGFDERFFVYFEELDLSYRIHNDGGKIFYNPSIKIIHKGGGTTENVKSLRLFYELRSRLKYTYKNFNVFSHFLVLIITFFIEPFSRIFYLLYKKNFSDIKSIVVAYLYFIKY